MVRVFLNSEEGVIPITIFPSASLRACPRPIQVLPSNYALSMHVGSTATISQIVIEGSLNLEDASFLNLADRSAYSAQV